MVRIFFTILCLVMTLLPAIVARDCGATEAVAYMSVDEVQRGMVGIGRTVFQGTRIDTFQVETLGVLRNVFGPRSDIILARLSGGPLEETGVISGMSGSPVYIDGKLIGAVAYSFGAFAKEPIAGITPIAEMIGVLNRPSAPPDAASSLGFWLGEESVSLDSPGLEMGELKPVATPLVMSGFVPRVVAELREELLPLGLLPVQGGGGADPSLPSAPFEPGAALGVQLIRGDFSVTGIGTLTYREGDRVVGFGHPMLFGGSTAMPMTAAYIHQVLPSQYLSFKLGTASRPMGLIVQDRAPGIAGIVGREAEMIPTQIEIRSSGNQETFRMEVLRNRDFGPLLLRMAVTSALISAEKLMGETTVRTRTRIALAGHPALEVENVYAGAQVGQAVLGATTPLARLMQNPFERVQVEEVAFDLELEERARAARIEAVRLQKARFQPGDTVRVSVTLRPYLGDPQKVDTLLVIPAQARRGRLILRVSSASAHRTLEVKRAPDEYRPRDLEHLIRLLSRVERNDDLILVLLSAKRGVTVEGRAMSALPPSVLSALRLSRESGTVKPVRQTVLERMRVRTEHVLFGSQAVSIYVDRERNGAIFNGKAGRGGKKK